MVDGEEYGQLISPQDEPEFQLNLSPGKHECYLTVIPKDKDQEVYESNILVCSQKKRNYYSFNQLIIYFEQKIDIPSPEDDESEAKKLLDASAHVYIINFSSLKENIIFLLQKVLEQNDLPVPKLNVQIINASFIRANWSLDRPIPTEASVTMYELHVRGQNFPNPIKSDEK